jgi:hypothetical protein
VDGAFGARRLALLERAFAQTGSGVIQKLRALGAEPVPRPVLPTTIDVDHCLNGPVLPFHSQMIVGHPLVSLPRRGGEKRVGGCRIAESSSDEV